MATNKELVEQAVSAIPKWKAFLDKKQAEQNLILEQMQDDEAQFAPKSLTERLKGRFTSTPEQPKPLDQEDSSGAAPEQSQVQLEKNVKEEEDVKEENPVEEEEVPPKHEPVSSKPDDRQPISNEEFNDIF